VTVKMYLEEFHWGITFISETFFMVSVSVYIVFLHVWKLNYRYQDRFLREGS